LQKAKTGDIILTYSSKNIFSFLHSIALNAPVTHVGLIVKHESMLFMLESGAPRGVQLRYLRDYMNDGPDYVWWMPFDKIDENYETVIQMEMEKIANKAYNWNFLKSSDLLGYDSPYESEELGYSCADLVVDILLKSKILKSKKQIFPKNFIDNSLDWKIKPLDPVNILFHKLS